MQEVELLLCLLDGLLEPASVATLRQLSLFVPSNRLGPNRFRKLRWIETSDILKSRARQERLRPCLVFSQSVSIR